MKTRKYGFDEKETELVNLLTDNCKSTGDIQANTKKIFAGTIEQMPEFDTQGCLYERLQDLKKDNNACP